MSDTKYELLRSTVGKDLKVIEPGDSKTKKEWQELTSRKNEDFNPGSLYFQKVEEQEGTKCPNCDGVGIVFEGIYPIGDCPVCDGTGTIQEQEDPLESEKFEDLMTDYYDGSEEVRKQRAEEVKSFIREKFKIK